MLLLVREMGLRSSLLRRSSFCLGISYTGPAERMGILPSFPTTAESLNKIGIGLWMLVRTCL